MLAGAQKDRICVRRGFIRQRCDMEPTEQYIGTARAIVVSDLVSAICVSDVDLNDDQVWLVVENELLDVFILQRDFKVGIEICGESCQAKWRKE